MLPDGVMVAALLDLDRSLLVQIVLFLVTVVGLNVLVFKPLFRVMDRRRELTAGRLDQAQSLKGQAVEVQGQYDRLYATIVAEGDTLRKESRESARKREQEVMAQAKAEADARRETSASELARDRARAEEAVAHEAAALEALLVEKVTR